VTVDLDAELTRLGELTDAWIRDAIRRHMSPSAKRLAAMLEYHLGWRGPDLELLPKPAPAGKKLRPALVLLVSQAFSGTIQQAARNSAAAVELIHNFSLVHDDIQDHSELRRHRPTVWTLWGMPQGINVGDALFALAQVVVSEEGSALAAQLAGELNRTTLGLSEGQFLDIDLQDGRTPATLEIYEDMVSRKTGVLFACACRMGAMAAGASVAQQDAYAAYGMQLGIAFQEQDDLLGVWGLATDTGKPDAADIIERKRGLPAAMALGQPGAPEWLKAAYIQHADEPSTDMVDRIIAHFETLGLRSAIEKRVEDRYRQALACLDAAQPREPWRGYLAAICEVLVSRRT
jgi:geranylgeranyl diphosphate synthase type I